MTVKQLYILHKTWFSMRELSILKLTVILFGRSQMPKSSHLPMLECNFSRRIYLLKPLAKDNSTTWRTSRAFLTCMLQLEGEHYDRLYHYIRIRFYPYIRIRFYHEINYPISSSGLKSPLCGRLRRLGDLCAKLGFSWGFISKRVYICNTKSEREPEDEGNVLAPTNWAMKN